MSNNPNQLSKKQIIVLFSSLLLVGSLATWFFFFKKEKAKLSLLVPQNVICLTKIDHPSTYLDTLFSNSFVNTISPIPFVNNNIKRGKLLKNYLRKNLTWLDENPIYSSIHVKSREELGTVFYIILDKSDGFTKMEKLLKQVENDPSLVVTNRNYKKSTLTDIKHRTSGEQFSYVIKDNIWVGSMSPVLVEDVIKNYESQKENKFVADFVKTISKPASKMQLCFNFAQFHTLHKYLLSKDLAESSLIENIQNAQMDLTLANNRVLFNGWVNRTPSPNWSSIWIGQEAQVFYLKSFLPNNAATFDRISISNEALFFKKLKKFHKSNKNKIKNAPSIIDLTQLESQISKEILQVRLEEEAIKADKLLLLRVKEADETISLLKGWASQASSGYFHEKYKGHQTFELAIGDLPEMLLGQNFEGFEKCFITKVGPDVVVFANNYKSLQTYIQKLQKDEVWAKSVRLSNILNQISEKQNWTSFVQPTKAWKIIENQASPLWKNYMKKYGLLFKNIKFLTFQANAGGKEKVWLTIDISLNAHNTAKKVEQTNTDWTTALKTGISQRAASQPFIVKNHKTKQKELLIQDTHNALKLLTLKGKQLWSAKLDSKITSVVHQIDYYKNNKLQYLFSTEKSLYLVDRNGNRVANYPVQFGSDIAKLNALALFDYDQNKKYRIWLSDSHGKVRLLDKKLKTPEGWKLRSLSYRASKPAQFVRIKDADFITLVQNDGKALILNRRGQPIKGFPIDLNTKISNDFFVQKGASKANSSMTLLSDSGELINLTFSGVVSKKQLVKTETTSEFRLIRSIDKKHFIILRQQLGVVEILNDEGEKLFETKFATGSRKKVQYFYHDTSTWFVAITDRKDGFTYVFDTNGSLIGKPIPSDQQIYLDYSEQKSLITVYTVHGKILLKKTIQVP